MKEWDADKVGQKSYFFKGRALCGVCGVPRLPQKRGCFSAFLLSYWVPETFPFILLVFQWCVSSARADKRVFGLPVSVFFSLVSVLPEKHV